jgi:hypothetical protein
MFPNRPAGNVIRALAWLGPEKTVEALEEVRQRVPRNEREALLSVRHQMPTWLAEGISALATNAT